MIVEEKQYGPTLPISQEIHAMKYRGKGETFKQAMVRVADALKDNEDHYHDFKKLLLEQKFLPAGRVQAAMGSPKQVTPFNCFVSNTINDSMQGIMQAASEAAETMRLGGGIGYDFSTIRPKGDYIKSLDAKASGPISFMLIFDALCKTISSAGNRRGAQMAVLRVDHPDIEEFIECKSNIDQFTQFNISVGVTDAFMDAVKKDKMFDLTFEGRAYRTIKARYLWDKILRLTWNWAEPGVLFIDRMNSRNNLWYCETIAATNPCGEQPLPPYGACLLGSFNATKYVKHGIYFDTDEFRRDIPVVVRAMDNIIDRCVYPLPNQQWEAQNKRRMGLGLTGLANAIEALGFPYASPMYRETKKQIMSILAHEAYRASIELAKEKGAFPLFDAEKFGGEFFKTLPQDIQDDVRKYGIRNSHLLSIAPTGTISLSADNISSGIEPVFSYGYDRIIQTETGPITERVEDYGYRVFGVKGKTANECSVFDHVDMLTLAAQYVDSACSKTCNVGDDVTWEEFKEVYMRAYEGGAVGCTTFRASGKRAGIFIANASEDVAEKEEEPVETEFVNESEGGACYYDPSTGRRTCE